MERVLRRSWLRSPRPLWIALALLIVLLSVGGYLITSRAIRSDRDAAAARRARAESVETQQILGRARAYVQGLSNVLASERRPGQGRFATLAAGTAASVGLDDVLWVQRVPDSRRGQFERRLGARISRLTSSGRVAPAPKARSYLPATFTSQSRAELLPGVDVSSFPGLADAIRDRATVFATSASKAGSLGDEPGFYLLQSANFGRSRGFLAAFVPSGWFVTTIGEDPRRIAISLDGRQIEGGLDSVNATTSFDTLGRRWRIDVAREPPSSLQSTLPWLALAWPLAVALIAGLIGRTVMLRRRAESEYDEIYSLSPLLLCTIGFDGYYKHVNPSFARAFGYSQEKLLTMSWEDLLHPDELEAARRLFPRVTAGKELIGLEDRCVRADGSELLLHWNARPVPDKRVIYAIGMDVTDRRRAERELEASRAELAVYAEDQAALRRVATLVAEGASPAEVLGAVVSEVGRLFDAFSTRLLRYEEDDAATVVAVHGSEEGLPVGTRVTLEGESVSASVQRTGRPARMTKYEDAPGSLAGLVRSLGFRSGVGAPITVEGRIWGVMVAGWTQSEPPLLDAEARMAGFTELVATAIANAESRAQLDEHVEQQAALRRVATLVAEDVPSSKLFEAVAREVGTLLGGDFSGMARFEGDAVITVGVWAADGEHPPVPPRWQMQPGDPVTTIAETRAPARWNDWAGVPGPIAEFIRGLGIRSTVGTPIVVEGRLWGALALHSKQSTPLPPDTESRMGQFTDLVGTAVANADARAEVDRLAKEQAALRRVATLVAKEAPPAEVFAKVAEELANVIGEVDCSLFRDEGDGTASAVAVSGARVSAGVPVGTRLPTDGDGVVASVLREGRSFRIGDYSERTGAIAARGRELGIHSGVGCPIVVRGRIWGVMGAARYEAESLPLETERRIARFAELVATAIANAEARAEVERLAEEQAALRRVAMLVAEGASPAAVFDAVAAEMEGLLGADGVTLSRYEPDEEVSVVAHRGSDPRRVPPGTRVSHRGENVTTMVRRSERPARVEHREGMGALAEVVRNVGVRASVGAPIVVDGRLWGVSIATWRGEESPPADTEERMAHFAELLDTAIANADSRDQLTASRARLVTEGDEARRRVVRDLHDGAQQRLVHTIITLKLAQRAFRDENGRAESLVGEALDHAQGGNEELRELAHGILPAVLTSGGLRVGIGAVVERLDLPIDVDVPDERLPAEIEASAYFIVAEALTNVVKHSHAGRAQVRASVEDGMLHVEVRDDGIGGADPGGHGLVGLEDRATALGGRLEVESPAGGGTIVAAMLPLVQ